MRNKKEESPEKERGWRESQSSREYKFYETRLEFT